MPFRFGGTCDSPGARVSIADTEYGSTAMIVCYAQACSVVVALWRSGVYVGRIARRAGLGHGYIYGMLRDAGENPK